MSGDNQEEDLDLEKKIQHEILRSMLEIQIDDHDNQEKKIAEDETLRSMV